MVDINHSFVEQTTQQTHTGDTAWTDITGASITSGNFTPGNKYLIVANGQLGGSSTSGNFGMRTVHGSTSFVESEHNMEPTETGTPDHPTSYGWFTVWTAVASEDIKLQFQTLSGGNTVRADQITLVAIELEALTENTDYFFDFNNTTTALNTTFSSTNNASITFSPSEASDWLVFSYSRIDPDNTSESWESRIQGTGGVSTTQPLVKQEGEDTTNDRFNHFMARGFSLTAVSHTFTQQSRNDAGTGGDRTHNAMFAINMNKFEQHSFSFTQGTTTGSGGNKQIQTTSITPTATKDVWAGTYFIFDAGNDDEDDAQDTGARMQIDNVDQPPTQTSDDYELLRVWDTSDLANFYIQSIENLDDTAHTVDLDIHSSDNQADYRNRLAFAIQMTIEASTETFEVDAILIADQMEMFTIDAIIFVEPTLKTFDVDARLKATPGVVYIARGTEATEGDSSGTSITVNFASHLEGDLLIAYINCSNDSVTPSATIDALAGWTEIADISNTAVSATGLYLAYHIATSDDEILTETFTSSASTGYVSSGSVLRGADQTTPIDVIALGSAGSGSPETTLSVTTTLDNVFVVRALSIDDNLAVGTTPSPSGYDLRFTHQEAVPGNGVTGFWYDMVEPTAGATGTENISWTGDTGEEVISAVFGIRPSSVECFRDYTVDAIVVDRNTETFTVDALLQQTFTEVFTVDAFLELTQVFNFTIDALLQGQITEFFLIDGLVKETFTTDINNIDAIITQPSADKNEPDYFLVIDESTLEVTGDVKEPTGFNTYTQVQNEEIVGFIEWFVSNDTQLIDIFEDLNVDKDTLWKIYQRFEQGGYGADPEGELLEAMEFLYRLYIEKELPTNFSDDLDFDTRKFHGDFRPGD